MVRLCGLVLVLGFWSGAEVKQEKCPFFLDSDHTSTANHFQLTSPLPLLPLAPMSQPPSPTSPFAPSPRSAGKRTLEAGAAVLVHLATLRENGPSESAHACPQKAERRTVVVELVFGGASGQCGTQDDACAEGQCWSFQCASDPELMSKRRRTGVLTWPGEPALTFKPAEKIQ